MALKALSGVTQGASRFTRLPNGFTRSSKLTQTLPIDAVNKATIRVVIGTTAVGTGVFNRSATAGVTIGVSASGQQTDQQHYGTATVGVVISSTASASVTSTHSGTATASIVITTTASGATGATHAGTANIGVAVTASASGNAFTAHSGTATVSVAVTATASGNAISTHSGVASVQVNLSASAGASSYDPLTEVPDESGENNVMVLNGATFSSTAAIGNRSVDFAGNNASTGQYPNAHTQVDNTFQSLIRSSNFSISAWVQFHTSGNSAPIISISDSASSNNRLQLYRPASNYIQLYISSDGDSRSLPTATGTLTGASTWFHIVATVGSNSNNYPDFKAYIDGSLSQERTDQDLQAIDLSQFTTSVKLEAGRLISPHSSWYLDGRIDDISIWDKELSSTEVSNLYNSGSGTDLSGSSNLVGWWKMGDSNIITHSGAATVSVDVTASASGETFTTHSGTASCQVNLSASASGTHVQGDESIVEGLSGKLCWFDANDITGSSNGDALSSWPSRHDSGVSASNSTSSTQPIYNTNQVNSLPAVNFDADYLEVNYGSNTSQPLTAFIVCAYDVTSGGGSNNAIDGRDNPSGYRSVNFSMRTNGWGSYAGSSWMQPSSGSPDTNWHYFTVYLNGASSYVRKDGVSHATGNPGTQGTNGQILGMWKGKNTSYYMNGKIAEVLIFGGTLSDTNRNTTESYLKDKYNL